MQQPLRAISGARAPAPRRAAAARPPAAAPSPAAPRPRAAARPRRAPLAVRAFVAEDKNWHQLALKHVVQSQQFGREAIDVIFREAQLMEKVRPGTPDAKLLEGRIMATLFYEPSTRTRLSFESAMARLGGTVLSTESAGEYSSAAKGETLEDTIRTVENYADCIVLRHFQEGSALKAAGAASIPILNAGDGPGQHPSQARSCFASGFLRCWWGKGRGDGPGRQPSLSCFDRCHAALLDLYSIQKEIGRLDNVRIGMVGDLLNGRTVRSLAYLLSMYPNTKLYFVSPKAVRMKDDIKEFLTSKGIAWEEVDDLQSVASDVDVLYMTRIQKERFTNMEEYAAARGKYIIDARTMSALPKHAVVLHPLPRVDEISTEVDDDPRCAYFRQARNGLYIRMALIKMCVLGANTRPAAMAAAAAALLLLPLLATARAADAAAAPLAAKNIDALCLAARSPWLTAQKCDAYLGQLEAGIGSMTSFVQQEFVPLQGAAAAAPKFEPSVVFATWEGSYVTSGANPVKEFEPIVLTAVVDGVLPCKKEAFTPSKLFSFRQLGLTKPLAPAANAQGLQAMCQVTAMSQTPSPAGGRLAQPWGYMWGEAKGATADNGGLYLGCQDYNGGGLKFDGVMAVSCSFTAQFAPAAAAGTGGAAGGARPSPQRLPRGKRGAAAAAAPRAGALAGDEPPAGGGAKALAEGERPDARGALAAAMEAAVARGTGGSRR
ncbi:MAG: Aspartate/ornithine carbamoyltransferase [Monoraphidium minutum]|nr:MAG: Aspartate/ornithine carbamoyltransferase [Monoraphidium minutum]